MALTTARQFSEALQRANRILVAFPKEWTMDAAAASLALAAVLDRRGKKTDIACDGFEPNEQMKFLPGIERILPAVGQLQPFVITLDVSKTKVDELAYDVENDKLRITIVPKTGQYRREDVGTEVSDYKYDLIITVDAPDYASLGSLFRDHADFLYHRPVIAVAHDAASERFGNINLVDITASSAAEIIYRTFKESGEHFLNEEIATLLLTGVVAKTRSFRSSEVTPKTLEMASDLVAAGARRAEIVQNLYRTRTLPTLKLWGRALARLKFDAAASVAWSVLVRQDFAHSGADESQLPDVISELIANSPEAEIICLLYEQEIRGPNGVAVNVCGLVSSEKHADALGLVSALKPTGHRRLARLCFENTTIMEVERTVLNSIRASLGKTPAPLRPEMTDVVSPAAVAAEKPR